MTEQADIWRQTAAKWSEVTAAITESDWDRPTTCAGWSVRDLVDHTLQWQGQGGGMVNAGTSAGDDWATIEPALSAALDDPANLEGTTDEGMPRQQVVGFVVGDLLIHSWDLARTLGVDETLPAGPVQATLMGLARVPDEVLRGENMFGPAIEMPETASPQDRLLGLCGRQP